MKKLKLYETTYITQIKYEGSDPHDVTITQGDDWKGECRYQINHYQERWGTKEEHLHYYKQLLEVIKELK